MNIDLYLFSLINKIPGKSEALDRVAIFFSKYLPFILVVLLFVFSLVKNDIYFFLVPVFIGALARAFNQMIFLFYQRKRPFESLSIIPLVDKPNYPAFPSSHSAFFFALSFSASLFNYQLAVAFTFFTCFIVLARVYCRLHWPSDIVAGGFMGLFSFWLAITI